MVDTAKKTAQCCSFCKAPKVEGSTMITSQTGVLICSHCVEQFKKVIDNSADGVIRPTIQFKGSIQK